jgi:hypothetical protein
MILSYKYNYIFLKAHKVGGTSVQLALSGSVGPKDIVSRVAKYDPNRDLSRYNVRPQNHGNFTQHMRPWEIIDEIGRERWDDLFKFTCVRNPWDMTVSMYYYSKADKKLTFNQWMRRCSCNNQAFVFWEDTKEEVCNDYIRFERLQKDYNRICRIIGVRPTKLPITKNIVAKKPRKKNMHRKVHDAKTVEIVARKYKQYIERFGYEYE